MSEERVVEGLKALRDADRECEAGPEVEAQLVLALRRRRAARMWTRAGAVAIAAGVGAIMLLHGRRPEPVRPSLPPVIAMSQVAAPSPPATVPASKPRAARTKSPVLQEVDTEFYPLMEFAPPFERGELVRVTVRASAMADVGLFVNPTHLDDPVQADVLIGQEGLARAIRFVSYQIRRRMRNTLTMVAALMAGCAAFAQSPAQETVPSTGKEIRVSVEPAQFTPGPYVDVSGGPVIGAPYSAVAVTETNQTLADGNHIQVKRSQKVYRDGQGRERTETGVPVTTTISDPTAKVSYRLDADRHTAVRTAFAAATLARLQADRLQVETLNLAGGLTAIPKGGRAAKEDLPAQSMEGVLATGTRTTVTIPAGEIGNEKPILVVDEVWYSPELKVNVMTRHTDPRAAETVYKLTEITRAEPDPSLFQVPPGYTMVGAVGGGSITFGGAPPPPPPPPPPPQ